MTRSVRVLVAGLLAGLMALGLGACTTPTIPIPPPRPGDLSFEVDEVAGTATFTASPRPEYALARVDVYDRTSGEGVIATADATGAVATTRPFTAALGDEVEIEVTREDDGAGICLVLRAGALTDGDRCTE